MARKGNMSSAQSANAHLVAKGIMHGMRQSRPYPNSGGLSMVASAGSSKYQRLRGVTRGKR